MNKTNNKKLRISIIIGMLMMLAIGTYIYLPNISHALETKLNNIADGVAAIITPPNGTESKRQIREHRGWSKPVGTSYAGAAGHTGIKDIDGFISSHLNNVKDESYGWYYGLKYNTSLFCQQHGTKFPDILDIYIAAFHTEFTSTNHYDASWIDWMKTDYIEYFNNLSKCTHALWVNARKKENADDKNDMIENDGYEETVATAIYEKDLNFIHDDPLYQYTFIKVKYHAENAGRALTVGQSYIFSYSERKVYNADAAQLALWAYMDQSEHTFLSRAALAVEASLAGGTKPIAPRMTKTSDNTIGKNTGTVIDGENYKIGPIEMNGYTYMWSDYAKDYSGELICGITEMKVKLDNGDTIILNNASSFTYSYEDPNQLSFDVNVDGVKVADSPYEKGYIYPTPNSKFYIKLPITSCTDATKIETITATYKWTYADGTGGDLYGVFDKLLWESQQITRWRDSAEGTGISGCTYSCDTCHHTGLKYYEYTSEPADHTYTDQTSTSWDGSITTGDATDYEHSLWCGGTGYCEYGTNGAHYHCSAVSGNCDSYCGGHKCNGCSCPGGHTTSCSKCGGDGEQGCDTEGDDKCPEDCEEEHSCTNCGGDGKVLAYNGTGKCSGCVCNTLHYTCSSFTGTYCNHGHDKGRHEGTGKTWGDAHEDWCGGISTCKHNHHWCVKLSWKLIEYTEKVPSQALMYVADAQVYEHKVDCYIQNIPLVTNVTMNKYIKEVKHTGLNLGTAPQITFGSTNAAARKKLTDAVKQANPVYVETLDYITYQLELTNNSAFGVKVKVDDILPAGENVYTFIETSLKDASGNNITDIEKFRETPIAIGANNVATLTVTIQVLAEEGIYENKARIITRNGSDKSALPDIDYVRTVDDDGPVVNHIAVTCQGNTAEPIIESSDWFKLNNYNVHIDKYVHKYDQAEGIKNNNNKFTNEPLVSNTGTNVLNVSRMNAYDDTIDKVSDGNIEDSVRNDGGAHEKFKLEHPLSAEKNETVTYAIKVANEAKDVTKNEATGVKEATLFKPSVITDKMHEGLEFDEKDITAEITDLNGNKIKTVLDVDCEKLDKEGDYNVYEITVPETVVVEPDQAIVFYLEAKIVQSNMFLPSMSNTAEITKISNVNDYDVTDRNISNQKTSVEYIRMKDLIIAGSVWLDINRDGMMNEDTISDSAFMNNNNVNNKGKKKDVVVRLYRVGDPDTVVRTTKTDANGLYTFSRNPEATSYYPSCKYTDTYSNTTTYDRVDKASAKDTNGNYSADSTYYSYYVEFVYDGVLYKSTEFYAGMDNLTQNDGRYNTKYPNDSNAAEFTNEREDFNRLYEYISYDVAYDLQMGNPTALDFQKEGHASILMEDTSREMTAKSFVLEQNSDEIKKALQMAMNSCGAAKWKQCSNHWGHWQTLISMNIIDESKYPNTEAGRKAAQAELRSIYNKVVENANAAGGTQMIKYLWLYAFNDGIDNKIPETNYLKYINLGLELREDVDLALSKDIYQVKTTINGEEMIYDFNVVDGINGNMTNVASTDSKPVKTIDSKDAYLQNYIVQRPYGFEIYESDYKYRFEQYAAKAVENYKGNKGEDELNVEVTFRITLDNVATTDDDNIVRTEAPPVTDTKLNARVHEVVDLYDTNFMELQFDENGMMKTGDIPTSESNENAVTNSGKYNQVAVKVKNAQGYLETKNLVIGEAWYYKKAEPSKKQQRYAIATPYINTDLNKDNVINSADAKIKLESTKPTFVESDSGEYIKVPLRLSNVSSKDTGNGKFSERTIDLKNDGYNTVYITGMSQELIKEGEQLDIYVKYVLDKDSLDIKIDQESHTDTKIENAGKEVTTLGGNKVLIQHAESLHVNSATSATLDRSLKVAEKIANKVWGRGTEGIAQINAYSVWYEDGKPASIVDKDSNAGNIGVKNTTTGISPKTGNYKEIDINTANASTNFGDDVVFYEDSAYKTGIQIHSKNSENDLTTEENKEIFAWVYGSEEIDPIPIIRQIKGTVWDDSRSETLKSTEYDIQHIGNGIYTSKDKNDGTARMNENVKLNYKDENVTETNDIAVRSAKAEIVEIIEVPVGNEIHYYEEILTDVTWPQKQYDRTDENGEYILSGFKPGNYIVRFTYGDVISESESFETLSQEQKDMLIFNGQDYKSTTYYNIDEVASAEKKDEYSKLLADTQKDVDKIIQGLEQPSVSDARDDEIRRLEVNAYSEIMTNRIAEILKGTANGTSLTPNNATANDVNSPNELKALAENTYMIAETRQFLVKPEKLTKIQNSVYVNSNQLMSSVSSNVTTTTSGVNSVTTPVSDIDVVLKDLTQIVYNTLSEMRPEVVDNRDFIIENVDFGIVYRPESDITLLKEIEEIKLIPQGSSEDEPLVDLIFASKEDATGKITHYIDESKSKGFDLVKIQSNTYDNPTHRLLDNLLIEEHVQGLVFVEVDEDLLQGCKVEIAYKFAAENTSEVDRIARNLDEIRYYKNPVTQSLLTTYGSEIVEDIDKYTASGTARNVMYEDAYDQDDQLLDYRTDEKLLTTANKDGDNNYFGRYTGMAYHTGEIHKDTAGKNIDVISELKVDKILDYVDTGLKYEANTEQKSEDIKNRYWEATVPEDLVDYVVSLNEHRVDLRPVGGEPLGSPIITNTDGIKYSSLVVSKDTRTTDNYATPEEEAHNINNLLSKFLEPKVSVIGPEADGNKKAPTDDQFMRYAGRISLDVSQTLSSDISDDDTVYENVAEVIQFTVLNGRRTNFATTIGNADVNAIKEKLDNNEAPFDNMTGNPGSIEYIVATLEPDTSATETVTLIPPTGIMKSRRPFVNLMETTKTAVEVVSIAGLVVGIIAVIALAVIVIYRRIKKRRIV